MKHGLFRNGAEAPREYWIWVGMKQRCENPNNWAFKWYGGRGIKVCDRWQEVENFLADMGPRPTNKHGIDRIETDGDYAPGNCRWATAVEQANNRRNGINIDGMSVAQIARTLGMSYSGVYTRLNRGWAPEEIAARAKSDGHSRRSNRFLAVGSELKTLSEWASISGLSIQAISWRLKSGWAPEKAIFKTLRARDNELKAVLKMAAEASE